MSKKRLFQLIDAAALGSIEAAAELGEGYLKGSFDGTKNYEKAFKWSCYAAKRGSERAAEVITELKQLGYGS